MKVFISYAHQDKDKAFYLKERLEKMAMKFWEILI